MASFKETNDHAVSVFVKSLECEELKAELAKVLKIAKDKDANEENKNTAIKLVVLLGIKYALLNYSSNSYERNCYDASLSTLNNMKNFAVSNNAQSELVSMVDEGINIINIVKDKTTDLDLYYSKIFDQDGIVIETKIDAFDDVITKIDKRIEEVNKIEKLNPFVKNVVFVDQKEKLILFLEGFKNKIVAAQDEAIQKNYAQIVKDYGSVLKDEMAFKYEAYPTFNFGEAGPPHFLVLFSPLEIEAKLATYYFEITNKNPFLCINAQTLTQKDINLFGLILDKLDTNLLIFNLTFLESDDLGISYGDDTFDKKVKKENKNLATKEKFLKKLFNYSKKHYVFIHNNTGNKEYFDYYVKLATEDNILESYEISYNYLKFPDFDELIEFLEKREFLNKNDEVVQRIKTSMMFLGFSGLNELINAHAKGLDWYKTGVSISASNYDKLLGYLDQIPNQELLISSSWGDVAVGSKYVKKKAQEYDYDRLRNVNVNNIKKIINSDLTVIQKIGVIGRYILFAGEDDSFYKNLSKEEQLDRIRMICELIYVLYEIDYLPKVILEKSDSWWGLCCGGGTLIKFDERHATNPGNSEDLLNTIFHECRHSFQHFAMDHPFNKKWETFGYTRGFVRQLSLNNAKYMTTPAYPDEAYRYQIMEADANACGFDCRVEGMRCYNLVDFE